MTTRRLVRIYLIGLLTLALSGCGGFWPIRTYEYDHLPVEKVGLVFASVMMSEGWPQLARLSLRFHPVGNHDRAGLFEHTRIGSDADIHDGNFEGQLRVLRLPPGTYEITSVGVFIGGIPYSRFIHNKGPFSYRFNVEAGKATYLGSFAAQPHQVSRALGTAMNAWGLTVIVDDKLDRDADLLEKQGHKYAKESIALAIMTEPDTKGSVFQRTSR